MIMNCDKICDKRCNISGRKRRGEEVSHRQFYLIATLFLLQAALHSSRQVNHEHKLGLQGKNGQGGVEEGPQTCLA